jgi:hypothetical protein
MIYSLLHSKSNNKCKGRYLIFVVSTVFEKNQNQRTVSSEYLKSFRIKEPQVLGIWKNQIQRIASFGCFRNFKEPPGFKKEPAKTQQFEVDIWFS